MENYPKKKDMGKYSNTLLEKFQNLYYKKFKKHISKQKASIELNFLAQIVKLLLEEKLISHTKNSKEKKW